MAKDYIAIVQKCLTRMDDCSGCRCAGPELVGAVAEKARIAAFDMVEFMPDRDIDGMGAMLAAQMLAGVTGIIARQG